MARPADLLPVEEARDRILAHFQVIGGENVPLSEALGRVLAVPVSSSMQIPPFANSSMDGFALLSSSTTGADRTAPVSLPVTTLIAAGSGHLEAITDGAAARIMTGAPLPGGADAVIPFEEVHDHGDRIDVFSPVRAGACVRPAGQDVMPGKPLLDRGTELHASQIALLAAAGIPTVDVTRRPVVSILATGDELVAPGDELRPGQIYNSNSPMLAAAVAEAGGFPRLLPVARDDPAQLSGALRAAEGSDLILTSGGASVGDFDHVREVLGAQGSLGFWRVRMRPGKPLIFGHIAHMPFIGLPGNPTSAMVTFEEFARPAIRCMLGAPLLRPEITVIVDEHIDNHGGRETYARVRLTHRDGRFHAVAAGGQDSAMLYPLAHADGLLRIPAEYQALSPGDEATVQVWWLPHPDGCS